MPPAPSQKSKASIWRHGNLLERVVRQIRCPPSGSCHLEPMTGGAREPIHGMQLYLVTALYRPLAAA